jgi:hypothetical protein
MKIEVRSAVFALAAAAFLSGHAQAQNSGSVPLTNMNFDMWCQEERHLPPERCDKRLPQDDAAFSAYRAKIEDYEVPYLQERKEKDTMNRVILHNDPIDHPSTPETPKQPPPDSPPPN